MINQWRRRVVAARWNLLELVPADYSFLLSLSLSLSNRQCLKDNCVSAFLGEVDDGFFTLILNGMSSMLRGLVDQLNAFHEYSKRRISIKSWRGQMRSDAWCKYCDTCAASYLESLIRWTHDDFWTVRFSTDFEAKTNLLNNFILNIHSVCIEFKMQINELWTCIIFFWLNFLSLNFY